MVQNPIMQQGDSEVSLLFEPNNLYALDTIAMQIVVFRIMY